MDVLAWRRRAGKTRACIDWARDTHGVIVVPTMLQASAIRAQAPDVDVETIHWWASSSARRPYVIDEVNAALALLWESAPAFVTLTPDWLQGWPVRSDSYNRAIAEIIEQM